MTTIRSGLLVLLATLPLAAAQSGPVIGEPAPAFSLQDTRGDRHALARYRGSWVVLEWANYGCPFVQKHYRTGNIPSQQREWTGRGVIWLSVVSSAPGTQGYHEPAELDRISTESGSEATAILPDPDGTVARAYQARTTPHLFVIDPGGVLVYMGGIDDMPTSRDEDLRRATQLVDQALAEATAGDPVSIPTSRPYGCTVKYR